MTDSVKTCPKCGAAYGEAVIFCQNDGTVLDQSAGELTGQIIADRYRVISQIGEGGMGTVYLAEQIHMKRKCAVKFLNPDLAGNPAALKRFIREASNASRIDHPNVVTIYDFGETQDKSVYLAMEFVEGESLRKRIERDRAMPRDIVASIVRQTASALQAAHALGIVHRDLKPDNIMLVTRDGDLRVKVVDFGIAKAKGAEQKVTVTGAIVGTPDYMSPEQLTGDDVDAHTDQYALALVAVKMLTGKLPFAATTSIESMTSRLTTAPMALRQLRADVAWPQQLQDVIGRALSSDSAQRFAGVVDFSRAFDKAIGSMGSPLSVTVPDLPVGPDVVPPTRKRDAEPAVPVARPMWPMALAAAVVLAAVGGTAVWFGMGRRDSSAAHTVQLAARTQSTQSTQIPAAPPATTTPAVLQQADTSSPSPPVATRPKADPAQLSKPAEQKQIVRSEPTKPAPLPPATASPAPPDTRVVAEKANTPAPDTSTRAAAPPAAVTMPSSEVASEFAAIRALVSQDAPAASLASAVSKVSALLPRLGERTDSVRFLYVRAQAHALQDDQGNACKSLATALVLAQGSRLEDALKRTSSQLNCP